MPDRIPPDAEPLPEPMASRVLTRASELEAKHSADATVAELRAAALEAGISVPAFDAALAEIRAGEQPQVLETSGPPTRRSRLGTVAAVIAVLAVAAMYTVSRRVVPVSAVEARPAVVEEAVLLRCLPAGEAAELIRPLLSLPTNTIVNSPEVAPRVLTIRATPEQMQKVRALLEKQQASCPITP